MDILVTHKIPDSGIVKLQAAGFGINILKGKVTKKRIIKELKGRQYSALLPLLTDEIDEEVIEACGSNVKIIANYAVGYNNINIEVAKKKGIVVTNTPGVLTDTVAEHTIAMILAVSTRIVEADKFVRNGLFKGWEPELLLGQDLKHKTLGIIGAGRIGSRVAEIAYKGFNMDIAYYDIKKNDWIDKNLGAKYYACPEDVFRFSDVVSIHLPLLESTYHFVDRARLLLMKPNAFLVNSSRGKVIDEIALTEALAKKVISGAALDVFEFEPKISSKLKSLQNVVLSPHTASASKQTRSLMSTIAADNIISVLSGDKAINPVF